MFIITSEEKFYHYYRSITRIMALAKHMIVEIFHKTKIKSVFRGYCICIRPEVS
jgi:hypothetical protein